MAVYIVIDGGRRLLGSGAEARESLLGIILTAVSAVVMPLLGWIKFRMAAALRSGALRADAYDATLGWWWADPLAALAIVPLAVREGLENWRAECHDSN